jgi:hypothetical protein
VIPFALRYLQDEKQIAPAWLTAYHAAQMLPYLITQPDEMKDVACTLFCALQTQANIFSDRAVAIATNSTSSATAGGVEPLPNPPASNGTLIATTGFFREYLDGSQVSEVIQIMDLPSMGQVHPVVDEILMDRIESLKRVDFTLFFASIRLYLNVYQAISWLKDDILDYLWTSDYVLRVPVPLTDEFSIELTKWKVTLLKRAATNTSNLGNNLSSKSATIASHNTQTKQALRQGLARFTHNYHLHPHRTAHNVATLLNVDTSASGHYHNQYDEQDVSHWKRLLLGILEEERTAMVISVGVVVERFVKALLQYR